MAKMVANFYHPDGRFLFGYDEAHTFPGEMKNTLGLLAYENGIQPGQITVKREKSARRRNALKQSNGNRE